ncbi:NUDIX hydrolase [Tahibacter sp.]|uniref:NUDIX hydrolase n=1 Tax=Tahibacter sp. TaxID=2056211 RepID=UPI0039C9F6CA
MSDSADLPAQELAAWQYAWLRDVDAYAIRHADEQETVAQFRDFMRTYADAAQRELAIGHLTGAAWLVSADGRRVLLTHHRKLQRWLQLGGHADGDADLVAVALREAEEESGLADLSIEREIFDLDRHWIPDHREVPGHWHYDLRYVVRCCGSEQFAVSEESLELAWRDIGAMIGSSDYDESLQRMARKWRERTADGIRFT